MMFKDFSKEPFLVFPIALLSASFLIRLFAWHHIGTGTIESEGAEYAKIAENIRNGVGYVGLVSPGPQLQFPPLFSFLIAATSYVTPDYETAGRIVALIVGTLLPLAVFGIANELFGRTAGIVAALLALFHPALIHLSYMVLSEGPYATLLLFTIYLFIRTYKQPSLIGFLLVGSAFGICYLVRAEALAHLVISLLFFLAAAKGELRPKIKSVAYAAVAFLIFALPQIAFVYSKTGRLLIETKSTNLSYLNTRILVAEKSPNVEYVSPGGARDIPDPQYAADNAPFSWTVSWAYWSIGPNATQTGEAMRSWLDVVKDEKYGVAHTANLMLHSAARNVPTLLAILGAAWFGGPILSALAFLGAFGRPWPWPQGVLRLYLAVIATMVVVPTFFVLWDPDARYYFLFIPLICVWAGNGICLLREWTESSLENAAFLPLSKNIVLQWTFPAVLVLGAYLISAREVAAHWEFSGSDRSTSIEKDLGEWIKKRQDQPIRVMDVVLPVAYHAGAYQHMYPPYSSENAALEYLKVQHPDYVILRKDRQYTKYYSKWRESGIPDSHWSLVPLPEKAWSDKFAVFRWNPNGQ